MKCHTGSFANRSRLRQGYGGHGRMTSWECFAFSFAPLELLVTWQVGEGDRVLNKEIASSLLIVAPRNDSLNGVAPRNDSEGGVREC